MANSTDKQRMMDENLVYWINHARVGILQADPTALVTIGFFVPQGPNPTRIGDDRVIRTRWVIADSQIGGSTADFVDLHPYLGSLSIQQYVQNFEIDNSTSKPILMGEFGANKESYSTAVKAGGALQDWQIESCKYGFDGWSLWTWDGVASPEWWNALDEKGTVDHFLSPQSRPDPCLPGSVFQTNISRAGANSSSTVSGKLTTQSGIPIGYAQIQYSVKPLDGSGVYALYTFRGTAPATSNVANVGFRVNTECGCDGPAVFSLYEVDYQENGNQQNQVPNPDFSFGLNGWGLWGNGTAGLVPSDRGQGQMLQVTVSVGQYVAINSQSFSVAGGTYFTLTFAARISPSSVGSGYFSVFFSNGAGEVSRDNIDFEPGNLTSGITTTDDKGNFSFMIGTLPQGHYQLEVRYAGNGTFLPAYDIVDF